MSLLIERAGEVVAREELYSELWQADTFVDFDHGLNNAVARIREVLEDSSSTPRYVETLPRRGYRFIAPLSIVLSMPDLPPLKPELIARTEVTELQEPTHPLNLPAAPAVAVTRWRLFVLGAVAIAAPAALVTYYSFVASPGVPGIRSLAVLPLKSLSGDPTQDTWPMA